MRLTMRSLVVVLGAVLAVPGMAGCALLPGEAPLLRPADCFGDVAYAFTGWTTAAQIGQREGPADGRVFALITTDEIVLDESPPAPDGSTVSIVGRGVCWTWPGAGYVAMASLGPTRQLPNP